MGAGWAILEVNDSSDSCVSLRMGEMSSKKIQKLSRRHMCIHVTPQTNQCAQKLCFSDSDVVNMISVDIVFLQKALRFAHLPWAFPLQLLLSVSFLYSILGMSILQGTHEDAS